MSVERWDYPEQSEEYPPISLETDNNGDWVTYEDYVKIEAERDTLRRELEAARAEIAKWETEISEEMPLDMKDWWNNSKKEWPLVARLVLENRRKSESEAWAGLIRVVESNEKLRADLAAAVEEKKTWDKVVEDYERQLAEAKATDIAKLQNQLAAAVDVVNELMRAHNSGRQRDIELAFHNGRNFLARMEAKNG